MVIATARDVKDLETRVKDDKILNTHVVGADLSSASSLAAAAKTTGSLTDEKIDHLLINGAYLSSSTQSMDPTDFTNNPDLFLAELDKSNATNVAGPLFAINAFLPLLRKGKEKRVTYISSGTAPLTETLETRLTNSVPYSVSKAAGNIIIAKFAAEMQDQGFIFLSIAPGAVATETLMDTSNRESYLPFLALLYVQRVQVVREEMLTRIASDRRRQGKVGHHVYKIAEEISGLERANRTQRKREENSRRCDEVDRGAEWSVLELLGQHGAVVVKVNKKHVSGYTWSIP